MEDMHFVLCCAFTCKKQTQFPGCKYEISSILSLYVLMSTVKQGTYYKHVCM